MTHIRTQVRKAITALLDPIEGITVYQNMARRPDANELPVISVRTPGESSSQFSADEQVKRELNIIVTIMAQSDADDVDDVLDVFAVEVEKKLFNTDLGGLLFDEAQITGTDLETFEEGAHKIAFLQVRYTATYHTAPGNPEAVE